MQQTETVTRYVPTFINAQGMRTLMRAAQGRHTFETADQAQAWLDAVTANNNTETLRQTWGTNPRFEVRPCACWPGHFDPMGVYFDIREAAPRYILTRIKADPAVAKRYQRVGWMAFDTTHERHGQVWPTRADAAADVARLNSQAQVTR